MLKPSLFTGVAAVAACALLAAAPAEAAKLRRQNLTQLITDAQSIVSGTVVRVTDGISTDGLPYTEVTLEVAESAKGPIRKGSTYTFRQFGLLKPRKVGNKVLLAVSPEGFPRWREGERVAAFLFKPASRTGLQTTAGLAQGKLTLLNGRLFNDFQNRGLFDDVQVDPRLLTAAERAMLQGQGPVDAATFMGLVGRAVKGNWIATGGMR